MVLLNQIRSDFERRMNSWALQRVKRMPRYQRSMLMEPWNGFGGSRSLQQARLLSSQCNPSEVLEGVQVLTRLCEIDLPYWNSFLRHYRSQGVRVVHVCIQLQSDQALLELLPVPAGLRLVIHQLEHNCSPNEAMKRFNASGLDALAQFTLMVDADEYFYAPNLDFTALRLGEMYPQVAQFFLPWLMHINLGSCENSTSGFWGHASKPLARTLQIDDIHDDHTFRLKFPMQRYGAASLPIGGLGFVLVHHWSRSFRDTLLKTLCTRFNDAKSVDRFKAKLMLTDGELPVRLRLLAYLDAQHRYLSVPACPFKLVNEELEHDLIRRHLSADQEATAWELFIRYRDALKRGLSQWPIYPTLGLSDVAPLLPSVQQLLG